MAFIRLRDIATGEERDFRGTIIRVGRDPGFDIVPTGPIAEVVSAQHLMLVHDENRWWIEDLGSSNGTYLDGEPLSPGRRAALVRGAVVRLGKAGPQFAVADTIERRTPVTVIEEGVPQGGAVTTPPAPADDPVPTAAPPRSEFVVVLRLSETGERYEARGSRVRIGRSRECDVQLTSADDTAVSRHHAEIVLTEDRALLRDLRSRNGTFVNGSRLDGDYDLTMLDCIRLGPSGPELVVEHLSVPGSRPAATSVQGPSDDLESPAVLGSGWARRRGGGESGRAKSGRDASHNPERRTARPIRRAVTYGLALGVLLAGGWLAFAKLWVRDPDDPPPTLANPRPDVRRSSEQVVDAAGAEVRRWELELADARANAAPAATVDRLGVLLDSARVRAAAIDAARELTHSDPMEQLESIESIRRVRRGEVIRLRGELDLAIDRAQSPGVVDSLRAALAEAERRTSGFDEQVRAIRAADLASVTRANRNAVGLVSAYINGAVISGSGFVVTPSGTFVTSGHVAMPEGQATDSILVTMIGQREGLHARLVAVSEDRKPPLAVLQIPGYAGIAVSRLDPVGDMAREGGPAVIIGVRAPLSPPDPTYTVKPSMSVGTLGRIAPDTLSFDGFSITASSGSPVFNETGVVVGVHVAGVRDALGLGVGVPIALVIELLPPEARAALGLPSAQR